MLNAEQSIWSIWVDRPEHPGKHVLWRHEIPMTSREPLSEEVVGSSMRPGRRYLTMTYESGGSGPRKARIS